MTPHKRKMCIIQSMQSGRVHCFPKAVLIHTEFKQPNSKIAGKVDLCPLCQFPEFSGAVSASAMGLGAATGEIAR